ncbi:hypothetical protein BV22DRAFT_1114028 [Leucogyrophana mollusca]|uniref:Uncharacterized protein n=1 Tax=Leucogyrophana mollusca TaxID=85980 RepID=A0ACB8B9R5_9AGAM|nr:hypothetical protein BV22DRAFT_1114028 [Leucogyrophana mollusca]
MVAHRYQLYLLAILLSLALYQVSKPLPTHVSPAEQARRADILARCAYAKAPAGPPPTFHARQQSDRYVRGTNPVLVKNATIWTGGDVDEVVRGDVLLAHGLIKAVGVVPLDAYLTGAEMVNLEVVDVGGAWMTPGIVDLHSHIGVGSSPELNGADDTNSLKAPILPWLRSIDGLNTHDASYELARSGGVTTAQILPGSANNIGGQAFVIKLRDTQERSPSGMLLEPPHTLSINGSSHLNNPPRWRHMKHACGENPSRVYSQNRMDTQWNFRRAYDTARQIRDAQDAFCARVEDGRWDAVRRMDEDVVRRMDVDVTTEVDGDGVWDDWSHEVADGEFPEDLQWEALVDVLRGKVKLAVHCYEAVDLDGIVRLSNEFKFPVASFHHAGETYLVPDLLKKTWGGAPSIALFASNFRKKREAYRSSEFAPRVLAEHGIPVVMKSDHPVVNSRYLLHEAAQAHYYGLDASLALQSVTSTPAAALGMGHRIGSIREGYDADIVVWDSHPLALGATPQQVYIDGIPQIKSSHVSHKPRSSHCAPNTPDFDAEAAAAVSHVGLPPLEPRALAGRAIFVNVSSLWTRAGGEVVEVEVEREAAGGSLVVVEGGRIVCIGSCASYGGTVETIDLKGGSIVPGLTTYGSPIGLSEIRLEASTNDGSVHDPLSASPAPPMIGDTIIRAVDGLQFGGRNTLLAYRGGVTTAVSAPTGSFLQGISTAFAVGAPNALQHAIVKSDAALHVAIGHGGSASVSTQIAALRGLLFGTGGDEILQRVRNGSAPLVVAVESADIMSTLLRLKATYPGALALTFAGAAEAHLIADEIAQAGVSVVVTSNKPYPWTWDQRRILAGPPITEEGLVARLLRAGVNVGVGVVDEYNARNTRFEVAWTALESNGRIDKATALALATTNLEKALGLSPERMPNDLIAYQGGDVFGFESKVVAVMSEQMGRTDVFV